MKGEGWETNQQSIHTDTELPQIKHAASTQLALGKLGVWNKFKTNYYTTLLYLKMQLFYIKKKGIR